VGAIIWVRAPKGHTFARHAHPTPERILLVRGRITGAVDGGRETTLMPGMYWGVGADAVHWARCEEACLMYITYDLPYGLRFP
jgi:quercetin dioxygenase-like cupin family protein